MSKLNGPAVQRLYAVRHIMWRMKKENDGGWNVAATELASSNIRCMISASVGYCEDHTMKREQARLQVSSLCAQIR